MTKGIFWHWKSWSFGKVNRFNSGAPYSSYRFAFFEYRKPIKKLKFRV